MQFIERLLTELITHLLSPARNFQISSRRAWILSSFLSSDWICALRQTSMSRTELFSSSSCWILCEKNSFQPVNKDSNTATTAPHRALADTTIAASLLTLRSPGIKEGAGNPRPLAQGPHVWGLEDVRQEF